MSAAFWVVKVDNLTYLFGSLFDAGRWPIDVFRGIFRGALRFVFTFVFPLALMTTYPALALLGKLDAGTALLRLAGRRGLRGAGARGLAARAADVHVGELVELLSRRRFNWRFGRDSGNLGHEATGIGRRSKTRAP